MKYQFLRVDVVEKLDGAGVAVIGLSRQPHRGIAQFRPHGRRQIRRGCNFDDFLVTPLHGAVALIEVQQIAVIVAENLHLKMARARQIFFQKDAGVAECGFCFSLSFLETRLQFRFARAPRACRARRRPSRLSQ